MERGGTEDKLIESTISMADYCLSHHMPCDVYFCEKKEIEKVSARTPQDFDMFYALCGRMTFTAENGAGALIDCTLEREDGVYHYIVVTHALDGALYSAAVRAMSRGNEVTVVFISDALAQEERQIFTYLNEASVQVVQIQRDRDFVDVFEQNVSGGVI